MNDTTKINLTKFELVILTKAVTARYDELGIGADVDNELERRTLHWLRDLFEEEERA